MKNYLLGCDWGTSSFRLRLINSTDIQLIGEITSQEGIANTFTSWKANGEPKGISREQFFRVQLQRQINLLAKQLTINLDDIPVVISGMASSSIGMDEVPYATLPFPVDGSLASIKRLETQVDFAHDIILISGVRTEHDVMRGEETQLIGLLALLDTLHVDSEESILIFPGTHSKHIYIQNQQVVDFQTFMTGEVFNLMSHYSILKDSVESNGLTVFEERELDAFKSGINQSHDSSILNSLFRVRTNQLFNQLTKRQNALYLSGLLIGNELKSLINQPTWQLILCSGNNLYELYKLAMEELHLSERTITISADLIDKATIAGQVKIAQNQLLPLSK
ncbi:2-dehydro-3-deoxygalactonokinase [Spirosoma endophyticum]|uniref:2-dehydro-3-deoxygalactonokinase n=1 Tax=Spirosoma endophyticum TaxID=662367 RepID=A0A1I1GXR7_9BACT|nr:2-dehydro-3-deoxygalactonokinase [Spirosoma endophyticum]SFC16331.1 2-dehydro-3-deoxygalactonokinase [Spirosoma endophyticum]